MLPDSILARGVLAPNSKAEPSAKGTPVRMRVRYEGKPVGGHRFPRFSSFWPSERNSPAGPTCR